MHYSVHHGLHVFFSAEVRNTTYRFGSDRFDFKTCSLNLTRRFAYENALRSNTSSNKIQRMRVESPQYVSCLIDNSYVFNDFNRILSTMSQRQAVF